MLLRAVLLATSPGTLAPHKGVRVREVGEGPSGVSSNLNVKQQHGDPKLLQSALVDFGGAQFPFAATEVTAPAAVYMQPSTATDATESAAHAHLHWFISGSSWRQSMLIVCGYACVACGEDVVG